jgi:hypothetical protein
MKILNTYVPKNIHLENLKGLKSEVDSAIVMIKYFDTLMHNAIKQINKEIENLNNPINQLDLSCLWNTTQHSSTIHMMLSCI